MGGGGGLLSGVLKSRSSSSRSAPLFFKNVRTWQCPLPPTQGPLPDAEAACPPDAAKWTAVHLHKGSKP
jgi:hypothetical protein